MPRKPASFIYTSEQLARMLEIQRALLNHKEAFSSVTDWAKRRGFSPKTAQAAVQRHVILKQTVHPPRKTGTTNLRVLSQLEEDTGLTGLFKFQSETRERKVK
jgi:hypothetical protein